ncbi:MAG: helix-turn-helix domain-containing protein [Planctomycetota bacterium]
MPWIQTEPEMERRKFVQAALRREVPMSELCARFGISRKTGYKMLFRPL